jgi:hypothetical protein
MPALTVVLSAKFDQNGRERFDLTGEHDTVLCFSSVDDVVALQSVRTKVKRLRQTIFTVRFNVTVRIAADRQPNVNQGR